LFSTVVPISIGNEVKILDIKEQSSTRGNTLYVGGTGSNNYTKIQDAIECAVDYDTVFVYNGIYYENLEINKSISLIGEKKNSTIIHSIQMYKEKIITVLRDDVTISNFTIKNSTFYGIIISADYCLIKNNIIMNNEFYGMDLKKSCNNITLTNNTIRDNSVGVRVFENEYDIISSNKIYRNKNGLGLYRTSYSIVIDNNISNNNQVGISCSESETRYNTFENNIIINNTVGINSHWGVCYNDFINNTIVNNNGSGIHFYYSSNHNRVRDNIIKKNVIGITFGLSSNHNDIEHNIIENENRGIGLYIFRSHSNNIEKNNFIGNENNVEFHYRKAEFLRGNRFKENYWDDMNPDSNIKIIIGTAYMIPIYDWFYWEIIGYRLEVPWINIDWYPANEPYDI
jgi:parallel beta-helix repeat protein